MRSLWSRIDEVVEVEGAVIADREALNAELAHAFMEWLEDRVLKDDVLDALRPELPDAPAEQLLLIAALVARSVGQS